MLETEPNEANRIEALLLELREAEQCHLFRPTPARVEALMQPRVARPFVFRLAAAGLALAACLALFTFALTWHAGTHDQIASNSFGRATAPAAPDLLSAAVRFSGCVAGPNTEASADCASVDYDGDGHVDLADYSRLQVVAHSM
jgi:hypothetical protein